MEEGKITRSFLLLLALKERSVKCYFTKHEWRWRRIYIVKSQVSPGAIVWCFSLVSLSYSNMCVQCNFDISPHNLIHQFCPKRSRRIWYSCCVNWMHDIPKQITLLMCEFYVWDCRTVEQNTNTSISQYLRCRVFPGICIAVFYCVFSLFMCFFSSWFSYVC